MKSMRDAPARGRPIRSISAVLPLVEHAPAIDAFLAATVDALGDAVPEFEVLIVEQGLDSAVARAVNEASRSQPSISTVHVASGGDYGAAMRAGIAVATKQYVLLLDPVGGYDPRQIEHFVQWGDRYDAVVGLRRRAGDPLGRRARAALRALPARVLFGATVWDSTCGFALIRASVLTALPLHSNSRAIHLEILYRLREQQATVHRVLLDSGRRGTGGRKRRARLRALAHAGLDVITLKMRIMAERRRRERDALTTQPSKIEHDSPAGTA